MFFFLIPSIFTKRLYCPLKWDVNGEKYDQILQKNKKCWPNITQNEIIRGLSKYWPEDKCSKIGLGFKKYRIVINPSSALLIIGLHYITVVYLTLLLKPTRSEAHLLLTRQTKNVPKTQTQYKSEPDKCWKKQNKNEQSPSRTTALAERNTTEVTDATTYDLPDNNWKAITNVPPVSKSLWCASAVQIIMEECFWKLQSDRSEKRMIFQFHQWPSVYFTRQDENLSAFQTDTL